MLKLKKKNILNKYIAYLLFEVRIKEKVHIYNEEIIIIDANTYEEGLEKAKNFGNKSNYKYSNGEDDVDIVFIKILSFNDTLFDPEGDIWHVNSFGFKNKSYIKLKESKF